MLGKLIKHEFLATVRKMVPVLLLMLGMSAIAGLALPVLQNVSVKSFEALPALEKMIDMFSILVWIVTSVSYLTVGIVAVIMLIERFHTHVLGNEGYTTMTLPVTVHEILWSKMIVFYTWFLVISLCVITGIVLIVRPEIKPYQLIRLADVAKELTEAVPFVTGFDLAGYLIEALIFTFAGFSASSLQVYAAMMIGQMYGRYRIAVSVIAYIILSSVFSTMGVFGITGAVFISDGERIYNVLIEGSHLHGLAWLMILVVAVPGVICYLITSIGMEKRLNLE